MKKYVLYLLLLPFFLPNLFFGQEIPPCEGCEVQDVAIFAEPLSQCCFLIGITFSVAPGSICDQEPEGIYCEWTVYDENNSIVDEIVTLDNQVEYCIPEDASGYTFCVDSWNVYKYVDPYTNEEEYCSILLEDVCSDDCSVACLPEEECCAELDLDACRLDDCRDCVCIWEIKTCALGDCPEGTTYSFEFESCTPEDAVFSKTFRLPTDNCRTAFIVPSENWDTTTTIEICIKVIAYLPDGTTCEDIECVTLGLNTPDCKDPGGKSFSNDSSRDISWNSSKYDDIKVFPNPNPGEEFKIELSDEFYTENLSIMIYNIDGKVVNNFKYKKETKQKCILISTDSAFEPGIYLANINNGKENVSTIFVVK